MAAKPLPDDPLPALLDALSFVFSFALAAITAITLQVVRLLDALFVSQFLQATHKHLDWLLFCIGAPPLAVFSLLCRQVRPTLSTLGWADFYICLLLTTLLCWIAFWGAAPACCAPRRASAPTPARSGVVECKVAPPPRAASRWLGSGTKPAHYVFVLDESSSMSGARWDLLRSAYLEFLHKRRDDQHAVDTSSVIYFAGTASVARDNAPSYGQVKDSNAGGGTSYSAGLTAALRQLQKTPAGSAAHLVFLSDGEDGDTEPTRKAAINAIKVWAQGRNAAFESTSWATIAFGLKEPVGGLIDIKNGLQGTIPGKEITVPDVAALKQAFSVIATSDVSWQWAMVQRYLGSLSRPAGLWAIAALLALRTVFAELDVSALFFFLVLRFVVWIADSGSASVASSGASAEVKKQL